LCVPQALVCERAIDLHGVVEATGPGPAGQNEKLPVGGDIVCSAQREPPSNVRVRGILSKWYSYPGVPIDKVGASWFMFQHRPYLECRHEKQARGFVGGLSLVYGNEPGEEENEVSPLSPQEADCPRARERYVSVSELAQRPIPDIPQVRIIMGDLVSVLLLESPREKVEQRRSFPETPQVPVRWRRRQVRRNDVSPAHALVDRHELEGAVGENGIVQPVSRVHPDICEVHPW